MSTPTRTHSSEIEDLFCQGHPLDHVVTVGVDVGWTRDDVMAVLREQQWDLDGSGRLPRSKRVTLPRGLRTRPAQAPQRPGAVPDRLTGRPLPTEEPTPAEAMAEQAELDVDELEAEVRPALHAGYLSKDTADALPAAKAAKPASGPSPSATPVPAPPGPETAAAPAPPAGRQPRPTEHGTPRGLAGHKRNNEPIPVDDSCGCLKAKRDQQAAYQRAAYRRRREAEGKPQPAERSQPAVTPEPTVDIGQTLAVECDVWFTEAQRSPSRRVQRAARQATTALLAFRASMDELARAQRAEASSSRPTGDPA